MTVFKYQQKCRCLLPQQFQRQDFGLDKLQNHTNEGKRQEKKKERGQKKEKINTAVVPPLVFMMTKKNCQTEKIHLAVTFTIIGQICKQTSFGCESMLRNQDGMVGNSENFGKRGRRIQLFLGMNVQKNLEYLARAYKFCLLFGT